MLIKEKVDKIYSNCGYSLYLKKESKYNFLFLKKNVSRARLNIISINRASRLFHISKEDIKNKIQNNNKNK
jgi:hypothetical protein